MPKPLYREHREEMIAKLQQEAEEEATQKGFCDQEMKKSKESQEAKQMTLDKTKARIDEAVTSIAGLKELGPD